MDQIFTRVPGRLQRRRRDPQTLRLFLYAAGWFERQLPVRDMLDSVVVHFPTRTALASRTRRGRVD
jgi:hypothetical protein